MAMNFEKAPVTPRKRLLPEGEAKEVTKRKFEKMLMLLKGEFDEIKADKRPTPMDFQGFPPGTTTKDLFKWVEKELGISAELLEGPQNEDSKEAYQCINEAYQRAKIFLKDTLKYSDKDIPPHPKEILSKKDVVDFLRKTVFVNNKISVEGMKNCRLARATEVAYETVKNDAELLKESAISFENKMVGGARTETPLTLIPTEQGKKFYVTTDKKTIKGFIDTRGKGVDNSMLKYLNRAESNAKTALKDGIASRISIEKSEGVELLPILCKWLKEEMGVERIRIGNQAFLNESQMRNLETTLKEFLSENSFTLKDSVANPTSAGRYKTIKITGELASPEFSGSRLAKQFEIQLVDPADKNEKGRSHHSRYEVERLVTARTRLDGGCPEHIFKEFLKDASRDSGMSVKTIEEYLTTKDEFGKAPSIIKTYRKNSRGANVGKPLYIAHAVYSRWDEFDWIDNSLVIEAENALKKAAR